MRALRISLRVSRILVPQNEGSLLFVPRLRFSSSRSGGALEREAAAADSATVDGTLLQGSSARSLGDIVRHGPGDACITLNVGGREFCTLRSTVAANAVLADHVARAEANQEVTKNGAVFVDRDPEHFCFVLKHLRNRVEWSTAQHFDKASFTKFTKSYVELPKDPRVLRELYVEATFYRIPELQSALCESKLTAKLASFFNKHGNPFDSATKLLAQLRTAALAAGTVGGTVFVTVQDDWDWILQKMGLRDKKDGKAQGVLD